jgi:hypothetical protein
MDKGCFILADWWTAVIPVCQRNELEHFLHTLSKNGETVVATDKEYQRRFVEHHFKLEDIKKSRTPKVVVFSPSHESFIALAQDDAKVPAYRSAYMLGGEAKAEDFAPICREGVHGLLLCFAVTKEKTFMRCRFYLPAEKNFGPLLTISEACRQIKSTPAPV